MQLEMSIGAVPFDLTAYASVVEPAHLAFEADGSYANALALAKKIVGAVIDQCPEGAKLLISCSWGKDSTALVSLILEVILERKASGERILPVLVVCAHTGGEFLDMEDRIESETAKLNAFAKREGLDIECLVTSPAPKNTLIAELCGGGRPLPKYSNSKTAGASEWCVDRLKVGPISRSIKFAKGKARFLPHFLGTRTEESAKRGATMADLSKGMPYGLTRLKMGKEDDNSRVGVTAIGHWSHEHLTTYLKLNVAQWNGWSFESLKAIYRKAAGSEDINGAGECRITFTKDGGTSNTCSDLSGARMGCILCIKAKNKALGNYAKADPTYRWIKAAHRFAYNGIRQHQIRMRDIKAHGFDKTTMFPKTYLFSWRVTLLALILRAELEHGHKLISPAVEEGIQFWWARSGIFTVTVEDIRGDVRRWIATGRLTFSYQADAANYDAMAEVLGEGLPGGVYARLLHPKAFKRDIQIVNLMPLASRGNGFYPRLLAYIFKDLSGRGGNLTMITDTPSDMGRKVNTEALNGYQGFALELIGVREPTSWELKLLRGRMFFYRSSPKWLKATIAKLGDEPTWEPGTEIFEGNAHDLAEIYLTNLDVGQCLFDKALADDLDQKHFIAGLAGKLTFEDLKTVMTVATNAADLSDALTDAHESARRSVVSKHRELLSRLGSDVMASGDAAARDQIIDSIKELWIPEDTLQPFMAFIRTLRMANRLIRDGKANTELFGSLATISRHAIYDQSYAAERMGEVVRLLKVTAPVKVASAVVVEPVLAAAPVVALVEPVAA